MKRSWTLMSLMLCVACGPEDTPGRPVEGELSFASSSPGARAWTLPSGWSVQLDEAVVLLGPLYLRPPKRTFASWRWQNTAHAHAQTLADGEVMGELLLQLPFDVLGPELPAVALTSEAGALDRLSIVLDAPRGPASEAGAHGYHAFMRGVATRGADRVSFSCGLRIDAMAAQPQNLEARRRVDNVPVHALVPMDDGARLRVLVHPERWFDFVSFQDFVGQDNPCLRDGSAFALQWYLGLRRPEAFSAELL